MNPCTIGHTNIPTTGPRRNGGGLRRQHFLRHAASLGHVMAGFGSGEKKVEKRKAKELGVDGGEVPMCNSSTSIDLLCRPRCKTGRCAINSDPRDRQQLSTRGEFGLAAVCRD